MKLLMIFTVLLNFLFISGCSSHKPLIKKKVHTQKKSLDAQLQNLADQIVISLSQKQKSKIAVIEFSNLQGQVTKFGRYLAEELITRLYRADRFEVIERQLLNKVLQEHQLNLSGLIDVNSAQELGRILGVEAIASGSVTDLGKTVKVNARLISTETGKIFSVASVTIFKDDVVANLMGGSGGTFKNPDDSNQPVPPVQKDELFNMTVKQNEFTFVLKNCRLENRTLTCSFIITNDSENDINLSIIVPLTKIFDEWGNEYPAKTLKLANSISKKGWYRLKKLIIPGIPTPAELVFENVSSTATRISLFKLKVESGVGEVKFRNIPLER